MCKFTLANTSLLQNKCVHIKLELWPGAVHMWKQLMLLSKSVIADGRMRVSIAVQAFDNMAYRFGQLQRIRKEDLTAYEVYVVDSRLPVDRKRVFLPDTSHSHTGGAETGA